jgi:hypothetical protein
MKKSLPIFLLFFLPPVIKAQFTLEHTFTPPGYVYRVRLELDGVKFYYTNVSTRQLILINEDYTLWKSIDLNIPLPTVNGIDIRYVSQTAVNPDSKLEFILSYTGIDQDAHGVSKRVLQNEAGTVLLAGDQIVIRSVNGVQKLINFATGFIYSIPGMVLEHNYGPSFIGIFEIDGMRQCYATWDANTVSIFGDDHTLLAQTIYSPVCPNCTNTLNSVSQTSIDPDSSYEFIFDSQTITPYGRTTSLQRADGTVIHEFTGTSFVNLESKRDGFDGPKLVMRQWNEDSTVIFHLPDLTVEKKMNYWLSSGQVNQEGIKGFPGTTKTGMTQFESINLSDLTPWHSFAKPAGAIWEPRFFSRHLFDADDDIEYAYMEKDPVDTLNYRLRVRDETTGSILIDEPYAWDGYLDRLPGAPIKLMVYSYDFSNSGNLPPYEHVYGFNASTGLPVISQDETDWTMTVAPNPGNTDVWIDFGQMPDGPVSVVVLDLSGRIVYREAFEAQSFVKIPKTAFGAVGMYVLDVRSGGKRSVAKVVRE